MHAADKYTVLQVIRWTRYDLYKFFAIGLIPVLLYEVVGLEQISVPWLPITMVGTAVAFLVAFKNNASYDRMWEARKIYGAIVNSSRSWAIMVLDFITNTHANADQKVSDEELHAHRSRLIHRHIAWLTALRYQLRTGRAWETMTRIKANAEYRRFFEIQEVDGSMADDLKPDLTEEEHKYVLSKSNAATQIINMQGKDLRELRDLGLVDDFRHMEMENMLVDLYTQQGKCERIKNFPYPRQYATINKYFIWLFVFLVPFGLLKEFAELGNHFVWLTVPFSMIVSWVFHTMERIGEVTENPFEGGANDVPITALSRTIEIDLREMLDESDLPEPVKPVYDILS